MHQERGPLTEHLARLDVAKQEIYDILISDFENKARAADEVAEKTDQEERMEKNVVRYRAAIRDEERIIMSFKRELSLLVETISTPEETAKDATMLARRYLAIESPRKKNKRGRSGRIIYGAMMPATRLDVNGLAGLDCSGGAMRERAVVVESIIETAIRAEEEKEEEEESTAAGGPCAARERGYGSGDAGGNPRA